MALPHTISPVTSPILSEARRRTRSSSASTLAALHRAQAQMPEEIEDGAVTAGNLAKVQQAWLAYREAWTAFARARYPGVTDAIRARITLDRIQLLRTIN